MVSVIKGIGLWAIQRLYAKRPEPVDDGTPIISTTFIEKDRAAMEHDLEHLADTAQEEAIYLFDIDRKYWFNIRLVEGLVEEDTESRYSASAAGLGIHFDLFGRNLSHYHTHPSFVIDNSLEDFEADRDSWSGYSQLGKSDKRIYDEWFRKISWIGHTFPSVGDIRAFVRMTNDSPDCNIDFRVISPIGMAVIELEGKNLRQQKVRDSYRGVLRYLVRKDRRLYSGMELPEAMDFAVAKINERMEGTLTLTMHYRPTE